MDLHRQEKILYNRLTEQIHLQTFTLKECEEYVQAEGLVLNREQILQYYMIFGGVPYYWGFLKKGYSLAQNIDRILFEAFTLFYFKFLENPPTDEHFWSNQLNTPAVNTWMDLAFERVCMGHIVQIKKKLGISGVLTEVSGIKFPICRCRPGQNMQFIQQWLPHMDS